MRTFIKLGDKAGHKEIIGETIAKLVCWENNINVYSRFLDKEAIDMVTRTERTNSKGCYIFKEVQIKYSKEYRQNVKGWGVGFWFNINKNTFKPRPNYYFMFICGNQDNIIIIPSITLNKYLKNCRIKQNSYSFNFWLWNNKWYFEETKFKDSEIDITTYHKNFEALK